MTGRRVLVVDDDPVIRAIARACLQDDGMEVTEAGTAGDGLRGAEENPPDALLLDCVLPDLDGLKAFEELRRRPRTSQIPVIFLTALNSIDHQDELRAAGATGVLTKPFDPSRLASDLRSMLGWDD